MSQAMSKSLLLYMWWVVRQRVSTAHSHLTQGQMQLMTSPTHQIQQIWFCHSPAKIPHHFVPRKNTIHERTKFYQRSQHASESVERFVRTLHDLAAHCNFGDREQEHIRDRLIAGMLDKDLSCDLQLEQDTDCAHIQDAAAKLPYGIINRWTQRVTDVLDADLDYPLFKNSRNS